VQAICLATLPSTKSDAPLWCRDADYLGPVQELQVLELQSSVLRFTETNSRVASRAVGLDV